jgi:hypothetical protein
MEPVRTLLYQYGAPTDLSLKPAESSKPILSSGYELSPELIPMVKDQSFSNEVNEKPLFPFMWVWANLRMYSHWGHVLWNFTMEAFFFLFDQKS